MTGLPFDGSSFYHIPSWGTPYFSVNEKGNLACHPTADERSVDLHALVGELELRNINAPILLRFDDILQSRIKRLQNAFRRAMTDADYPSNYTSVLPIKVNQQRHVIEQVLIAGEGVDLGLEVGSKPELLIAIAMTSESDRPIVCNGYKDREYIQTALLADQCGRPTFIVVDRFDEVALIIEESAKLNITPRIGLRVKLASRGSGKWRESSGHSSKFGLSAPDLLIACEAFKDAGLLDSIHLLHFHIGSQLNNIRAVKDAIGEGARIFVGLHKLGAANLQFMDVGGGLAVDYDGSQTNYTSSRNYKTQEYANDIVWTLKRTCEAAGVAPPTIMTESGRAMLAHHAVLIFNVLGKQSVGSRRPLEELVPTDDDPKIIKTMYEAFVAADSIRTVQESYNDSRILFEESNTLFRHGVISLKERAKIENIHWATCQRVQETMTRAEKQSEQTAELPRTLADTVFCNFSVFQSLPDVWAIDQLFPIVPIHRLHEKPTRQSVLVDLTCDSDGRIDRFISQREVQRTLALHEDTSQPYYLGTFLVGAYQETLGDLHNLFGDTNAVHVKMQPNGEVEIAHVVQGDSVEEVLSYVEYDRSELIRLVRKGAERAVKEKRLSPQQSGQFMRTFEAGLKGYTYLED